MVLDMDKLTVQDGDNGKAFISGQAFSAAAGIVPRAGAHQCCNLKILTPNCLFICAYHR